MSTKFPKTLGACVDHLYKLREQRLAAQKKVDETKGVEEALKNHILTNFQQADVEGARGKLASASVQRRVVADVQDWEALHKWVAKNDAWDMLQKRVNDTAYRARLDENVEVPGIEPYTVVSLSITKR
jgi:hypothetical protein